MNELAPRSGEVETSDIRPVICELRGQPVMLDRDLASLYHVLTGRLNEAVKRNIARFPPEFMFQLSGTEMKELIANCDRFRTMKHSPSRMYAFTEQGVAMLSDADVKTFNAQYPKLTVRYNESFHDRFLIIDDKELYLIGASLKDLGRKCFAFTKLDSNEIPRIKRSAFGAD